MEYNTLKVEHSVELKSLEILIDRPEAKNAINLELMQDLNQAFDFAEANQEIRTIVIRGSDKFFCTGMDFKDAMQNKGADIEEEKIFATMYCQILKRFATIPKIIVTICEGKVMAGGVGFVAASDIVIARPTASFCLSEAIWGLLPANVLPYLIRRSGFQPAYFMTMTTKVMTAEEARHFHLIDVLSEDPEKEFRKLNQRFAIIDPRTILRMKIYFRQMWIINESMEQLAIDTLAELKCDHLVQKNISNYIENGKLPWDV